MWSSVFNNYKRLNLCVLSQKYMCILLKMLWFYKVRKREYGCHYFEVYKKTIEFVRRGTKILEILIFVLQYNTIANYWLTNNISNILFIYTNGKTIDEKEFLMVQKLEKVKFLCSRTLFSVYFIPTRARRTAFWNSHTSIQKLEKA